MSVQPPTVTATKARTKTAAKKVAALGLACVLALSACGNKSKDGAGGDLAFVTDKAAWQSSFEAMNKTSGDLQLKFTGYSDPTAYDSYIKQSFRTNKKPDLFTWHTGGQLESLVKEGLVAETTDLWTEAEQQNLVPKGLKDQYTFDGKQYCVPLNVAYWAVYYNKKVFAKYNLQVPTTWDEMMKVAETLRKNNVVPFHQMNIIFEFVWFQAMLAGQNIDTYKGILDGKAKYTDPDVTKVMQQWQKMIQEKDFLDPGVKGDPQQLIKDGKVAMGYYGTFFTGQLNDVKAKSGDDYGIFMMPNFNPQQTKQPMILETGPMCVGKGSANEKQALEYSKWWMTTKAQTEWSKARGDVSFNPQVQIDDPELKQLVDKVTKTDASKVEILPRYLEGSPEPVYQLSTELFGDFVTNAKDPQAIQQKLQAKADEYWSTKK